MTQNHYPNMLKAVKAAFPGANDFRVGFIANKVTNRLRKLKLDIYEVEIASRPFSPVPGYFTPFELSLEGQAVFVRVRVD